MVQCLKNSETKDLEGGGNDLTDVLLFQICLEERYEKALDSRDSNLKPPLYPLRAFPLLQPVRRLWSCGLTEGLVPSKEVVELDAAVLCVDLPVDFLYVDVLLAVPGFQF
jgi:hypothetical protein